MNVTDLAAQQASAEEEHLSEEQDALAEHHTLAVLLHLLMAGWTPREIQEEFDLTAPVLVATLSYLDRLGFIDLLSGNKVRLRASRDIDWSHNARLKRSFDRYLKQHFKKGFDHPEVLWCYGLQPLPAPPGKPLRGMAAHRLCPGPGGPPAALRPAQLAWCAADHPAGGSLGNT